MENEQNEQDMSEDIFSMPDMEMESKIPSIDTESRVREMLGMDEE